MSKCPLKPAHCSRTVARDQWLVKLKWGTFAKCKLSREQNYANSWATSVHGSSGGFSMGPSVHGSSVVFCCQWSYWLLWCGCFSSWRVGELWLYTQSYISFVAFSNRRLLDLCRKIHVLACKQTPHRDKGNAGFLFIQRLFCVVHWQICEKTNSHTTTNHIISCQTSCVILLYNIRSDQTIGV